MAKELPYFKFEPTEWEVGNIQMLDREQKGLFIDLCSLYWQKLGDLNFRFAVNKLCGGNATAFDSLCKENVITIVDELICIHFLNLQLLQFEDLSTKNRDNATKGWEKRKKNKANRVDATALPKVSEPNAIREDKRREEKIREDKIKVKDILDRKNTFSLHAKSFNNIYEDNLIQEFIDYWTETNPQGKKMKCEMQKTFQINLRLKKWYSNSLKFTNNGKTFNNKKQTVYEGHKASYDSIKKYHENHNPFAEYDD